MRAYLSSIIPSHPGRVAGRGEFVLSSAYGTVRVYTRRHIHGCVLVDTNENRCLCPKWIYSKARGGKPVQESAHTPSFAEACELARKILERFAPLQEPAAPASELGLSIPATPRRQLLLRARITLAAHLKIKSPVLYAMRWKLYPRTGSHDSVKKLFLDHGPEIEREEQRLTPLPDAERDAIAGELLQTIKDLNRETA